MRGLWSLVLIVPLVAIVFACTKHESQETPLSLNTLPLDSLKREELTATELSLVDGYLATGVVDTEILHRAVVETQVSESEIPITVNELSQFLERLFKMAPQPLDGVKGQYELNLTKYLGSPVKFKQNAFNLARLLKHGELNVYSSTVLHCLAVMKRSLPSSDIPVVIFEKGHMLSGYLSLDGSLTGIETMVFGKGQVVYGPFHEVSKAVRVVDARLFLLFEVLKGRTLDHGRVADLAIKFTAARVGVSDIYHVFSPGPIDHRMDGNPFWFGNSVFNYHSVERYRFDAVSRRHYPSFTRVESLKFSAPVLPVLFMNSRELYHYYSLIERLRMPEHRHILDNPLDFKFLALAKVSDFQPKVRDAVAHIEERVLLTSLGEWDPEFHLLVDRFFETYVPPSTGEKPTPLWE